MIRILVDSSADFTTEELKERNLELISIAINIGEKSYRDGIDITRDELYDLLNNGEEFPKTSQPSPQDFYEVFEDAKEKGDSVICITISSGLSGTYQSAALAKSMADYSEIHLVDSLSATHLIRVLADQACKMRDEGACALDIVNALEELKPRVKVLAAVDTLEYLHKGGRLDKASAIVGELANLKPIITLTKDGIITVIGKCLGRNKALASLTKSLSEKEIDNAFPVYSLYAFGSENTEKLEAKLETIGIRCNQRLQIGATIGCHVGPGAFGIVYVEK